MGRPDIHTADLEKTKKMKDKWQEWKLAGGKKTIIVDIEGETIDFKSVRGFGGINIKRILREERKYDLRDRDAREEIKEFEKEWEEWKKTKDIEYPDYISMKDEYLAHVGAIEIRDVMGVKSIVITKPVLYDDITAKIFAMGMLRYYRYQQKLEEDESMESLIEQGEKEGIGVLVEEKRKSSQDYAKWKEKMPKEERKLFEEVFGQD